MIDGPIDISYRLDAEKFCADKKFEKIKIDRKEKKGKSNRLLINCFLIFLYVNFTVIFAKFEFTAN